jgi:hypothetical protein
MGELVLFLSGIFCVIAPAYNVMAATRTVMRGLNDCNMCSRVLLMKYSETL